MNQTAMRRGVVEFRVIHAEDEDFLRRVYAGTRAWEFEHTLWPDEEKQRFLRSQFDLQTQAYQRDHIGAVHRIIQLDGTDIGRLIVQRNDESMRIIDLAILPEYRGRGIGTDILRSLLNEAHGGKVPVHLAVAEHSPAINLYLRHGFRAVERRGRHLEMVWYPATGPREI